MKTSGAPRMKRTLISSGSSFEHDIGYSRAVVQGDWVFVSGTTGFDYSTMTLAEGIQAQAEQCLKNIEFALRQDISGDRKSTFIGASARLFVPAP